MPMIPESVWTFRMNFGILGNSLSASGCEFGAVDNVFLHGDDHSEQLHLGDLDPFGSPCGARREAASPRFRPYPPAYCAVKDDFYSFPDLLWGNIIGQGETKESKILLDETS